MKFSVGYQLFSDSEFTDKITEYKKDIDEIYFSWADFPNGRNNQIKRNDMTSFDALEKMNADLKKLSDEGLNMNLLFNAACYGKDSQSRAFFEKVGDSIDFVKTRYGLKSVTTTSPLIAKFIKTNFSGIDIRASVNMCIGSEEGMDYVKEFFDSFYLKRELNRDFTAIKRMKLWCDENGKTLYALANSGCLNNCSAHTFHDNLVSHESEISAMDNGYAFEGICHSYLKNRENIGKLAEITNFIRPEDIYLYEGLFPAMKLATRVNENPVRVLDAYIKNKKFTGSVLSLLEPNHTETIKPYFFENSLIEKKVTSDKLVYNTEKALLSFEEMVFYADE